MSLKRVLIVSSNSLFREGLKHLLAEEAAAVNLGQVTSLQEASLLAREENAEVVIIDLVEEMNNRNSRNEAFSSLLALPSVRVISLSLNTNEMWVYRQERVAQASVTDLVAALMD